MSSSLIENVSKAWQRRENDRRWLYILVAVALLPLTIWSAEESLWGATPCAFVLLLLGIQFARPTLLGWWTLILVFVSYAVAMAIQGTRDDIWFGVAFGAVPAVALLVAWPRRIMESDRA